LRSRLGSGGTATVWLADDLLTGEQVALKVVHEHLTDDPDVRARLARELRAAGRIRHPNALVARELHDLDGRLALTMPVHGGVTLGDSVAADGPLTAAALTRLVGELAGALAAAHAVGVVHRDVTPSNVLMAGGAASLVDFGLAHLEDRASRTATAAAVGTWGFAAPEVLDGVRADPRSDLYSMGAVLYLAATGRPPFDASTAAGVLKRQLAGDHVPLVQARPDLPTHLAATIDALLATDPSARPAGARAVLDAIEAREAPVARRSAEPEAYPVGPYTVIVAEARGDRRRAALRRLRGDVGAGEDAAPERALLRAIGKHGRRVVPDRPTAAMRRHEFKALEAVPHAVAEAVFADATRLGFKPRIVNDPNVVYSSRRGVGEIAVASVLGTMVVGATTISAVADSWLMAGVAVAGVVAAVAVWARSWDQMLLRSALPAGPVNVDAPEAAPLADPLLADPLLADPLLEVHRSTMAALGRLDAALRDADVPAQAREDLERHAAGLRAAADRLAAPARHLAVAPVDGSSQAALDRVRARLRQVEARQAQGEVVDANELARLTAALDAHGREAEAREDAERVRTLLAARLLEIGAAATSAARALHGAAGVSGSTGSLVERLEREAGLARDALAEVAAVEARPGRGRQTA
jgi:serine/threonine-protein kinase